jgi:hypothetical protein
MFIRFCNFSSSLFEYQCNIDVHHMCYSLLTAKMAEPAKETNHETEIVHEEEERENDDCSPKQLPNMSFLSELNLLIVFFSSFSLLNEERLNYMERQESQGKNAKDHEAKVCISRLHTNKRDANEVKLMRRPTPRFQSTIRDSRYKQF